MSLPMPEFDHLELCAECGHDRESHNHGSGSCSVTTDLGPGIHIWCPCPVYQPEETTP